MPEKEGTGLNFLLSVVLMLFMIGLVVFIFVMMGGSVSDATTESGDGAVANESLLFIDGAGSDTSVAGLEGVALSSDVLLGCYTPTD